MHRVPTELWLHICALACTDGGRTGRALSLTSRSFNEFSRPFKYQYLALTNPARIKPLVDTLQDPQFRCGQVKSLYVHCPDLSLAPDDEEDSDYTGDGSSGGEMSMRGSSGESSGYTRTEEDFMDLDLRDDDDDDDDDDLEDAHLSPSEQDELQQELIGISQTDLDDDSLTPHMATGTHTPINFEDSTDTLVETTRKKDENALDGLFRLLNFVSPTLHGLSIHWTSLEPRLVEEMIPPLPHLEELCLFRAFTGEDEVEPETDDPAPSLFPALLRLHIGGYLERRQSTFGGMLGDLAPNLRELQCSIYNFSEIGEGETYYRLSSAVEKVVLELNKHGKGTVDVLRSQGSYSTLLFGSDATVTSTKTLDFHALDHPCDHDEWEARWLERVSGRGGCWV